MSSVSLNSAEKKIFSHGPQTASYQSDSLSTCPEKRILNYMPYPNELGRINPYSAGYQKTNQQYRKHWKNKKVGYSKVFKKFDRKEGDLKSNVELLRSAKSLYIFEAITYFVFTLLSIPFALLMFSWVGSILIFVLTIVGFVATILSFGLFIRSRKLLLAYKKVDSNMDSHDPSTPHIKSKSKGNPKALYVWSIVGLIPMVLVLFFLIFTLVFL